MKPFYDLVQDAHSDCSRDAAYEYASRLVAGLISHLRKTGSLEVPGFGVFKLERPREDHPWSSLDPLVQPPHAGVKIRFRPDEGLLQELE